VQIPFLLKVYSFDKILPDLPTTSFPNTLPSPARVQIATIFFVPE
jgi:hypothetical protein